MELLGHFTVRLYAAFDDHGHRPASQFSRRTHKVFFSLIIDPLRLGHVPLKSGITFILTIYSLFRKTCHPPSWPFDVRHLFTIFRFVYFAAFIRVYLTPSLQQVSTVLDDNAYSGLPPCSQTEYIDDHTTNICRFILNIASD